MNMTAFVFFIFAGLVAFIHALLGQWLYLLITIPFIAALITKGKISRWIETLALFSIGILTIIMNNQYMGYLILFIATIWYLIYIDRSIKSWYLIAIVSMLVGTVSYIVYNTYSANRMMTSILDTIFYIVGAGLLRITLHNLVQSVRAEMMNMDKKKLDLIEKLQGALHEAIDTLKTEAPHGDKPRTNC